MPLSSLSVPTAPALLRRQISASTVIPFSVIDTANQDLVYGSITTVFLIAEPATTVIVTSLTTLIVTEYTTISTTTGSSTASKTSPNPTSTSGNQPTSPPFHLSGGGVAGIGVGAAVIGGLLAALIFWVCMRRYKHLGEERRRRSRNDVEKISGSRSEAPLEENLLERADDSQIRKSMQDLNELIDQHCENHYHGQAVDSAQGSLERTLIEAGYNNLSSSAPPVAEFARLLQSPNTQLLAIRQFIALVILSHVGWRSRAEVSLLPPQIAAFCQTIPPTERQPGSEEVFEKAFTKWRYLSAFLLEPIRSNRQSPQANQQELQRAIGRNVALINSVLKPFLNPGSESQRYQERNLSAIVFQAAQLGLLLFSQHSIWVFDWEPSRREDVVNGDKPGTRVTATEVGVARKKVGRPLVVFPAIGETIYRHGSRRIRTVAAAVEVVV